MAGGSGVFSWFLDVAWAVLTPSMGVFLSRLVEEVLKLISSGSSMSSSKRTVSEIGSSGLVEEVLEPVMTDSLSFWSVIVFMAFPGDIVVSGLSFLGCPSQV